MEPRKLVATDTVHAIPVSLLAGIGHLLMGNTDLALLGLLLIGSIPAVLLGARLLKAIPSKYIKLTLGYILVVAALKLLLS
jgi:uncharacterized membrane protein YfcA